MLLMTWFDEPFRDTRDLDLLGYGDPNPQSVLQIFREILSTERNDGVRFDANEVRIERIQEDYAYGGFRIRTTAEIDGAQIAISVDVGFGDASEPDAEMLHYPVLLDMPAPRLLGYARETVIAEKFQTIVALGRAISRMKEYCGLWTLSQSFDFERSRLAAAMSATFARRQTRIPEATPDGLTSLFAEDVQKQQQWETFKGNVTLDPGSLTDVVVTLESFLMPVAKAAREKAQ